MDEIVRIAKLIKKDFRDSYFDVYQPHGGAPQVHIAKTSFADSTADTIAENEGRLLGLAIGAQKLDAILRDLRSAHGLIAGKGASKTEAKGSGWTGKELEETEARARDRNPRGMSRGQVRSMR